MHTISKNLRSTYSLKAGCKYGIIALEKERIKMPEADDSYKGLISDKFKETEEAQHSLYLIYTYLCRDAQSDAMPFSKFKLEVSENDGIFSRG